MSKPIISVESLGKRYEVGRHVSRNDHSTFREALSIQARALIQSTRKALRRQPRTTKATEEFWALRDVSFEVQPGEVVGFVGQNGAGKSTLLKILSRITEPTKGRVTLRGRVASLLEVGTGFHPELTGRENIFLNGSILGMSRTEVRRKFDEIVEFSGVDRFVDTPVKRYSSGMYVRLAFSVAASLEPEILVIDEVLAVGDQQFKQRSLGKMRDISRSGRTVLFVSHDLTAVRQLCTKCHLLAGGAIARSGEADEVIAAMAQSKMLKATADLRSWRKRHGTNEARLLRFEITDATTGASDLRRGNQLHVVMHFEAMTEIERPTFGLLIGSADGTGLLDARSSHSFRFDNVDKGEWTVTATIDTSMLLPGEYVISLWINDPLEKTDLDFVQDCGSFSVLADDLSDEKKLDRRFAKVWAASKWSLSDHNR